MFGITRRSPIPLCPVRAAALVALVQALAGDASPAAAQAVCEGFVGPGDTLVLSADLGPCDGENEALLVESGTVDLGGHTVSCADTDGDGVLPYGIVLVGKKAQLRNGTVTGCHHDVVLADRGRHTVENVTAESAVFDGFLIDSSRNRVTGSSALGNGDDGFQIGGQKNKLYGNVAEGNVEDGLDIVEGGRHKLTGNTISGSGDDGLDIGGDGNKLVENESTANVDTGIRVGGVRNGVFANTATGNGGWDILGIEPCTVNRYRDNVYGTAGGSCVE
jgi:parallel beta-helix repeat protein